MNEFERRIRELAARFTQWFGSESKTAKRRQRRAERAANLRSEATTRAQQAAGRLNDFRESERGQRAERALHDLRDSDAAKRAESVINDLRASDAGKRAESALADLRQREPVKKAEESARKVMHDLFSGGGDSTGAGDPAGGTPAS
jgi:membrane protein involved in colicin uptake